MVGELVGVPAEPRAERYPAAGEVVEAGDRLRQRDRVVLDRQRDGGCQFDAGRDRGRAGAPEIRILIAFKPDPEDLMAWAQAGATELIWGVPDKAEAEVLGSLDRLAGRLGIG